MNGFARFLISAAAALTLSACSTSWLGGEPAKTRDPEIDRPKEVGSVLGGEGGISLFGGTRSRENGGYGAGISVNSFLWRASLDTVSFMPLASADPFGGVIITEWYSSPENPAERFKLTVYVLDRQLRADALKVAVFKQTRDYAGTWFDAAVDPKTAGDLENGILTRARQLRLDTTAAK